MGRLPALDGLRAFAVLAVVGFHYEQPHVTGGLLGVQTFFVLSGWLITRILAHEDAQAGIDWRAFYRRRALRLFPALSVVTIGCVVAAITIGPGHDIGWSAGGSLLYVNDLLVPLGRESSYLTPTWSLAVEFQFYLAWPVVLGRLLRHRDPGRLLLGVAIAMLGLEAVLSTFVALPWVYFTPLGCTAALMLGGALALRPIRVSRPAGAVAALILTALCFTSPDWTHRAFWLGWVQVATLASAGVVAWLSSDDGAPVFSSRAARWLGERSYGLYLIHQAVRVGLISVVTWSAASITAVGVVLSVLLAATSYRWVETPFLRRKRPAASKTVAG